MINQGLLAKWLQDYVSAWKSYDAEAIGALFSEDATYRYNPFDEPVRGRAAIVANWLEYRDEPNTYQAEYKPLAVDGDVAIAQGRTHYFEADGKTPTRQFDNIFVMRFDEDGRCVEFCEWYMQPRT
jgi:ketosteroid isomerase-like protein